MLRSPETIQEIGQLSVDVHNKKRHQINRGNISENPHSKIIQFE